MKTCAGKVSILGTLLLIVGQTAFSQGFINLNFESATIIPDPNGEYYPYSIAIINALPGWAVNGSTQGDITYNDPALGSSWVNLWATNGQQLSGNYSVLLQGGLGPGADISQTGLVPVSSTSILFEAEPGAETAAGSLLVSLGGQDLSYIAVGTGPNYTLYGANVSAFAGQTEELMFFAESGGNNWNIDNIQFSSSPVPEPGALALSALGYLSLALRGWRKSPQT
jgi:hypothetical protein